MPWQHKTTLNVFHTREKHQPVGLQGYIWGYLKAWICHQGRVKPYTEYILSVLGIKKILNSVRGCKPMGPKTKKGWQNVKSVKRVCRAFFLSNTPSSLLNKLKGGVATNLKTTRNKSRSMMKKRMRVSRSKIGLNEVDLKIRPIFGSALSRKISIWSSHYSTLE